jgi:UDP-4-amino-4,6-dideoxy-N-acetyl-beta-L-altrosamine transaminase
MNRSKKSLTPNETAKQLPAIPYGKHFISDGDIEAVKKVLRSEFLTQGPMVKEFEQAFAKYIGSKYAIAVSNGTAALHLCALALSVKPGDKVITTSITFSASANCVRYAGGDVVFADIDPKTYLLDISSVKTLLESSPKGTYKGIIPVDFAGRAVDLEAFRKLADEYGCWIIEDACHAPGGYFEDSNGKKHNCGNGDFAELAIFSFHPVKHIAGGEGGMITTNSETYYQKLLLLRTHGITKEPSMLHEHHGLWYYEMQELGFNYRLTDIQAALGFSQLKRAEKGLARRKDIAAEYDQAFIDEPYIRGHSGVIAGHAYHLYIIEIDDRKGLYDYLRQNNIYAQVHYIPVHLMPYYRQFGSKEGDLPNAENYYQYCLSLPMYPTLKEDEQIYVIKTIKEYFKNA